MQRQSVVRRDIWNQLISCRSHFVSTVIFPGLTLITSSCAHKKVYHIDMPYSFKDQNEPLSVKTCAGLAQSLYLLGCVEAHKKFDQVEGSYNYCKKEALKKVRENVIEIYEQIPETKH